MRASKTVNREKIDFVWDGQNLAAENKANSVNTYTYDITGVHIANKDGNITSYLKDYHGNIVGTTTVAGTMVQEENNRMDYDAFGNQWIGDTPDPFGYCGEYYDYESGLIYLRNRYYDSTTGRFINEDPIKDGLNWYIYANNNPVMWIDPLGLSDIPRWIDWNQDGFEDTAMDRERFDANNNNIADWIEAGYSNITDWNATIEKNILIDFSHMEQSGWNTCWAASASMVIKYLAERTISDIQIAKDKYGDTGYDKGLSSSQTSKLIKEKKYLDGSKYAIKGGLSASKLTKEFVKENIDAGIPIMISFQQHMRVIIGYDYSDGQDILILDDPSYSSDYIDYGETVSGLQAAAAGDEDPIHISGITFQRIR